MVAPFLPDGEKVAAVRDALPATGAGIYLNAGSAGPLPAEAIRAVREIEDWELRVGRASPDDWDTVFERMDEARGVVAAAIGAGPNSVALTHTTTDGMALAALAPQWREGDRLVTSTLEYPGVVGMLKDVCDRFRVTLAFVDVADGGDRDAILERFDAAIDARTRLVAVSHVSYANGATLPVTEIGELARRVGAWFSVDGAQAAAAIPVDVGAVGADFYALPAQKWLLGPEGVGALYASERAVADAVQSGGGGFTYEAVGRGGLARRRRDARRFDASTFHHPSIVGLARATGWLEMYVGLPWAQERAHRLLTHVRERLALIGGVDVLTPSDVLATIVSFRVANWTAEQARTELARRIFAITRTVPELDAVRVSVGFWNTEEELDRFTATVELLANHTPESIPRRPALVILPASPGPVS